MGHAVSYPGMLFNGSFDYSKANAKLAGLGIILGNAPMPPSCIQRFCGMLSHMWRDMRFRSAGYEMVFPEYIDPVHITYEYQPNGHIFSYEGPYVINQFMEENITAFGDSYSKLHSYKFVSKDSETKTIFSFIESGTLQRLAISEGVSISFQHASEAELEYIRALSKRPRKE